MRIVGKICGFLLAIGAIVVLLFFMKQYKETSSAKYAAWDALDAEYEDRAGAIRTARTHLEADLRDLKENYDKTVGGLCSTMILVSEPDEDLVASVMRALRDERFGYPAIVAVSENSFLGDLNCVTVAGARQLIENGWELALNITAATDIEALFSRLEATGLRTPTCAYFPTDLCSAAQRDLLASHGIHTIIQYRTAVGPIGKEDETYPVFGVGLSSEDARSCLIESVDNKRAIAFTVGYQSAQEKYDETTFQNLLTTLSTYVLAQKTRVTSTSIAYNAYRDYRALVSEYGETYENNRLIIEAQIAQKDVELENLEDWYEEERAKIKETLG